MDVALNVDTVSPPTHDNVAEWVLKGYYMNFPEEIIQKA